MADLTIEPLTQAAFAPYGTVIELPSSGGRTANDGTAQRFDDVTALALTAEGGRPQLSLMRVTPATLPLPCQKLERHPRSTQLFMPLGGRAFLVVVALGSAAPQLETLRAFVSNGAQGINYAIGTWHHAALALDQPTDFLVVGHASSIGDCDFFELQPPITIA